MFRLKSIFFDDQNKEKPIFLGMEKIALADLRHVSSPILTEAEKTIIAHNLLAFIWNTKNKIKKIYAYDFLFNATIKTYNINYYFELTPERVKEQIKIYIAALYHSGNEKELNTFKILSAEIENLERKNLFYIFTFIWFFSYGNDYHNGINKQWEKELNKLSTNPKNAKKIAVSAFFNKTLNEMLEKIQNYGYKTHEYQDDNGKCAFYDFMKTLRTETNILYADSLYADYNNEPATPILCA